MNNTLFTIKNILLKNKKRILVSILYIATAGMTYQFSQKQVPQIKRWILLQLEKQSARHTPATLKAKSVDFHILPPGLVFSEISLEPKKGLEKTLAPLEIEKASVFISFWGLVRGQLRLSEIILEDSQVNIILPEMKGKTKFDFDWRLLSQIPIDQIKIEKFQFQAALTPWDLLSRIEELNFSIENKAGSLLVKANAQGAKVKKPGLNPMYEADLETQFLADADGLYFEKLTLTKDKSLFKFTGALLGEWLKGNLKQLNARVVADLHLKSLSQAARELFAQKKIPNLQGRLSFESDFSTNLKDTIRAGFLINGKELALMQYQIGNVFITGKSDGKEVLLLKNSFTGSYGDIQLTDAKMNLATPYPFSATLSSQRLDVHALLADLGIPSVPVYTKITGKLPCKGQLGSEFYVDCSGGLTSEYLRVTTGVNEKTNIVETAAISADGKVRVDKQKVTYDAALTLGDSKGTSKGEIHYQKGFQIDYETPQVNFKYAKDLLGLLPVGVASIKGSTTGNSKTATMNLHLTGQNTGLYGYELGQIDFDLNYKSGILYFNKLTGQLGQSRYNSKLEINLTQKTISVDAQIPFLAGEDLVATLKNKLLIPFTFTGTGSGQVRLWGPLDIQKLSYDLRTSLYRGVIADESYDRIVFHVQSRKGFAETKQVGLLKAKSQVQISGNMNPEGKVKLLVTGRDFQIEQSENLSKLKLNMTGKVDFDMTISEQINKPKISCNGEISSVTVNDLPTKNSNFEFQIDQNQFTGALSLFGDVISSQVFLPFSKGFAKINAQAKRWNFAQIFSIFSEPSRTGSYTTSLSGQLAAEIPMHDTYGLNADVTITELNMRNGRAEMNADKTMKFVVKNQIVTTENFELQGANTYLRLISQQKKSRDFNLSLEGRVDLQLATLFTPFLEELRGVGNFSLKLEGPFEKPKFLGSSFLKDGHFKLKDFPHALEDVQGDTIFNQHKVIINSARGRIGGGVFSASGSLQLNNFNDVPVDVRGVFTDAKFNVPEGFNTRGSGEFSIVGKWFPYTLGVNYTIDSGSIERTASTKTPEEKRQVKPSTLLPKFLAAQRFSPIDLQLQINMKRFIPVHLSISRVDIRSEVNGQLKIQGQPESPRMTGKINVQRGGKVAFRNNTFEIKSGSVEYKNSKPENPILDVEAEARVTAVLPDNNTRDYDVELAVAGTASDPKISVSSEPPLSESELISLLTLGFISQPQSDVEAPEQSTAGQITNTSYQLGSAFLTEQLGLNRQIESRLGIQFDFSSSYNETDEAAVHKFTLKKQWTPKFGTSASRTIGKTNTNKVRAEYKLNKNLSVIGEWEGKESTGAADAETSETDQNLFGVDVEYRQEFK